MFVPTLREAPGDAEAVSHQLLVRAGYVRRLASGIYTFLPLGWRVLQNVTRVVREEMDAAGAQEMLMPVLHPVDVWAQTGRLETMSDILFRLGSKGGDFVLAPTHEEVVTGTVAADVSSYRQLPLNLYQVQLKYRDEARPRFGLLRCREFVMKDAYSFDASPQGMKTSYQLMYDAYCRIFERLEVPYTAVEAAAGPIGGDVNHEFMVPSAIGEDRFARCAACGYAANTEAATAGRGQPDQGTDQGPASGEAMVEHHTPDRPGIEAVVELFSDRELTPGRMLKCLAAKDRGGRPVVLVVPGDRDVRLQGGLSPFTDEDFAHHPELVKGYIGPMGLQQHGIRVVADHAVARDGPWVTGANKADHHVTGATLERDFTVDEWASVASVVDGDPCPRCGQPLELERAVEAGHTFQLGLTYSEKIPGASFLDEGGKEQPFWMGCYGIGVSRAAAVMAEEHHDDAGLCWPAEVAPFLVHLVSLGRSSEVAEGAAKLEEELTAAGISVIHDDRDLSAGVKFADADLLGMPIQLLLGGRGLARGVVERKDRATAKRDELPLDQVVGLIRS